ncbi:hypothetical protein, partial [Enterobacter hormaechei]
MQGFAPPPSSPGRRFLRLMPFFPSFSRAIFPGEPSRPSSLFICAGASGVAPASSAATPAVVSARRNPEIRRQKKLMIFMKTNNTVIYKHNKLP